MRQMRGPNYVAGLDLTLKELCGSEPQGRPGALAVNGRRSHIVLGLVVPALVVLGHIVPGLVVPGLVVPGLIVPGLVVPDLTSFPGSSFPD